jgi:hypothetical protein
VGCPVNLKELIAACDDMPNQGERMAFLKGAGVERIVIRHILACYN